MEQVWARTRDRLTNKPAGSATHYIGTNSTETLCGVKGVIADDGVLRVTPRCKSCRLMLKSIYDDAGITPEEYDL